MKRLAIVVAVASLLGLAQISQAANLQAGWYARINSVYIFAYNDPYPPAIRAEAQFQTALGVYGPFAVTNDSPYQVDQRYINVLEDVVATLDQSLILPLFMPVSCRDTAYFYVSWETNYDSSQMKLEFWHEAPSGVQSRIWTQKLSGTRYGGVELMNDDSWNGVPAGDYFFKVSVVPEPSSIVGLIFALPMFIGFVARRKQP